MRADKKRTAERTPQHRQLLSQELLEKIISLQDESGSTLLQKFSTEGILFTMEKHHIQIVELFSKYLKEGFNLLEFVRFFVNILSHAPSENLHLAIGLIDLFRDISLETHRERVVLKDLTDFMCEKILRKSRSYNKIEAKLTPFSQCFRPSLERKQYLQVAPVVYGESDERIHKLCQKSIRTDSSKHSRAIIRSQFCHDLKRIFILDALSESISVFDENYGLCKKLSPQLSKLKKDVIILSFAFSKRQFRIGAVLKDFSLKFWDHFNNFGYEKSIQTTSSCQHLQTNIYFLEHFNAWLTSDKTGTLHFWDLLLERPERVLKCKYSAAINGVCEIASLNLLVVVQECRRSSKLVAEQDRAEGGSEATVVIYDYRNGQVVTEISLQGMRIPHTVFYSETYQVLFMSGLEKRIRIYDLHPVFMDANLKGELIGHENLITCFTLVKGTAMLMSADDKGKVKLWDFRNYICLQTIDFSDKTVITNLLDMVDVGKIGIFGSRINYIEFEDRHAIVKRRHQEEALRVEAIDFDPHRMELFIFADRAFRVVDSLNGQTKHLFSFRSQSEEEYTAFRYFASQRKILLGKTNGETTVYSGQTGQWQGELRGCHEGAVSLIELDDFNKLYLTLGSDSRIMVHRVSDGGLVRELRGCFNGKEVSCLQLSVYHNLVAIGSHSSHKLYLCSYEYCKIVAEVALAEAETPLALHFLNGFGLLAVATSRGLVHLLRVTNHSSDTRVEHLSTTATNRTVSGLYSDVRLAGSGKQTLCTSCKLVLFCEQGELLEFDLTSFMGTQAFRPHAKEKANYNPVRECKENFASEVQKQKHVTFGLQETGLPEASGVWGESGPRRVASGFSALSAVKMLRMEQSYHVAVGDDRRVKVWDRQFNLLCDLNVKYCLPYKWDLAPTSKAIATEKIYYGMKVLETIARKYEHDISIGEAKNLELRALFHLLEKDRDHDRARMLTEPEQPTSQEETHITLLQDQFSRKDLNFELVKKFNFTEVAGPTLKELDNVKKIEGLQREWRVKEGREEREKESLLRNIEAKAKKNEEKDEIQMLFVRHKKSLFPQVQEESEKVAALSKKLEMIEEGAVEEKKLMLGHTFFKSIVNRHTHKIEPPLPENSAPSPPSHQKGRSFEQYYRQRFRDESRGQLGFREILNKMNGRVNGMKKEGHRNKTAAVARRGKQSVANLKKCSFI